MVELDFWCKLSIYPTSHSAVLKAFSFNAYWNDAVPGLLHNRLFIRRIPWCINGMRISPQTGYIGYGVVVG